MLFFGGGLCKAAREGPMNLILKRAYKSLIRLCNDIVTTFYAVKNTIIAFIMFCMAFLVKKI